MDQYVIDDKHPPFWSNWLKDESLDGIGITRTAINREWEEIIVVKDEVIEVVVDVVETTRDGINKNPTVSSNSNNMLRWEAHKWREWDKIWVIQWLPWEVT